jgi:hypothetical protein
MGASWSDKKEKLTEGYKFPKNKARAKSTKLEEIG